MRFLILVLGLILAGCATLAKGGIGETAGLSAKTLAAGECGLYVWTADASGNSTYCKTKILINETMLVSGFLYHDENNNCTREAEESGLEQSVSISLIENNIATYTIVAESEDGSYSSYIPKPQSTDAKVEIRLVNESLRTCDTLYTREILENQTDLVVEDIGIQLTVGCADLGVSVEAIGGNCQEESLYIIKFYNNGDQAATPFINLGFSNTVLLDFDRYYMSHAISPIVVGNCPAFMFAQALLPGQEGSILFFGKQVCDYDNQTQVITATIDAENACSNNWSGSELAISQKCSGEEVEFRIKNI